MQKIQTSLLAVLAALLLLSGCAVNPVTHKRELHLISESQEISIGQQGYAPARQQQGGDYVIDPELTEYVRSVGNKLAAVSDRPLPYEFVILNDSVPNAWAMPGGKIAFNRGLLYELSSEAELAAVLGHEITHAAARHGARSMETGMLLQGAAIVAGAAASGKKYEQLAVGAAQLGTALISTKFGRDDESEADHYGMVYMKRAGYDPSAAVTLQETFVRLSQGHQSNFIEGLFASHPPSEKRVADNKTTLAELGAGGELGSEVYAQKTAHLKKTKPAYDAYDEGVAALAKGDAAKAESLAKKAISIEPREARFQELLGDVAMKHDNGKQALGYYQKAIDMQPDYFRPNLEAGLVLNKLGRVKEAESYLQHSNELLPTATGYYALGQIAEARGDIDGALKQYEVAAGSDSDVGKLATADLMRLDLPRNPGKYLQAAPQADASGNLYAVVHNPTSASVAGVHISVARIDPASGKQLAHTQAMPINTNIASGQNGQLLVTGVRITSPNDLNAYRVTIESAELAK